jgi:hypothetical protein
MLGNKEVQQWAQLFKDVLKHKSLSQVNPKWYLLHTESVEPTPYFWTPPLEVPDSATATKTHAQTYLKLVFL